MCAVFEVKKEIPVKKIRANALFIGTLLTWLMTCASVSAQSDAGQSAQLSSLISPHPYVQKRASSYDRTGGNDDFRKIAAGETLLPCSTTPAPQSLPTSGSIASSERVSLEEAGSAHVLGRRNLTERGNSHSAISSASAWETISLLNLLPLVVAPDKALNCFFPMPFRKRARITVTNEGKEDVDSFYFNIDYQALNKDLPADTMYFPCPVPSSDSRQRLDESMGIERRPAVNAKKNLDGQDNYVWMEATGQGHFVGVTMSILQNQDGWWGEGDDMFFVDGEKRPSINGTGSEDYFLGAWEFWRSSFLLLSLRSAGERLGVCRQPFVHISISPGFADSLHQVSQSDDRTWPRQSSL
jgi:hypothetical protein